MIRQDVVTVNIARDVCVICIQYQSICNHIIFYVKTNIQFFFISYDCQAS